MEIITIVDDDTVKSAFSVENSLITSVWKPGTKDMTDDEFKALGLKMVETVKKYAPTKLFSDNRHFQYIITPEIQDWYSKNVMLPCIQHSLKRIAYLVSSDFFSQVSIEQLMEENTEQGYAMHYFEEEQKAFDWIEKDSIL